MGIISWAKKAVQGVFQEDKAIVGDVVGKDGFIQTGLSDVKSIVSLPLILIGGGVAAFLLFSGKNSSATVSYAR